MDPAPRLAGIPLVHADEIMRIWRTRTFMYTRLDKDIDDALSVRWRGTVDEYIKSGGWPTFSILDIVDVIATNSIAMRFQSASWARNCLQNTGQTAIFSGKNHRSTFIIKGILRVAGMGNVTVLGNVEDVDAAVASYSSGVPLAGVPVRTMKDSKT